MKKLLAAIILITNFAFSQHDINKTVKTIHSWKSHHPFNRVSLGDSLSAMNAMGGHVSRVRLFKLGNDKVKKHDKTLKIDLPLDINRNVLLYKVDINPTVITSDGDTLPPDTNTTHYQGVVEGYGDASLVSLSFSNLTGDDEVMGSATFGNKNYNIAKIKGKQTHICYAETDLDTNLGNYIDSVLIAPEQGDMFLFHSLLEPPTVTTTKCITWWWETPYQVYQSLGSVGAVNSWGQAVFNQVQTLYANDGITINLGTLFIWSTPSPYDAYSTVGDLLSVFQTYRYPPNDFTGDAATLIGFVGNGGMAVSALCSNDHHYTKAYCGVSSSYATVPTYSWTVENIAHEQGHVLGVLHTHNCFWNGNNTKIDDCGGVAGYSEGTCPPQPNPLTPSGGGTIMSYCHLSASGSYINLANGFGAQVADTIKAIMNRKSCLTSCAPTTCTPTISIAQSGHGCTGSASIFTATVGNAGLQPHMQWFKNNVRIDTTQNLSKVVVNGDLIKCQVRTGSPCANNDSVMSSVVTASVVAKNYPTIVISTSSTTVCAGTTTFTSSITNGGVTPSFSWRRNGVAVGGNTASLAYSPSNGDVVSCVLTSSLPCDSPATSVSNSLTMTVQPSFTASVSIVSNPSANSICQNITVLYTATPVNGGTVPKYQWRRAGVDISGATNSTLSTLPVSGSAYTVRLISNKPCCTSASDTCTSNSITKTVTTVTASVKNAVLPTGARCAGDSVIFTATPTNGGTPNYLWFKNTVSTGITTVTYKLFPVNGDKVYVRMISSNTCVSLLSDTCSSSIITETVTAIPAVMTTSITVAPNDTLNFGQSATFTSLTVNGTNKSFKWYSNSVLKSTAQNYTTTTLAVGTDTVKVVVTNGAACASPKTATSNLIYMKIN